VTITEGLYRPEVLLSAKQQNKRTKRQTQKGIQETYKDD